MRRTIVLGFVPLMLVLMLAAAIAPTLAQGFTFGTTGRGPINNSVVQFRQSGGFAGINRSTQINTADLRQRERAELIDTIRQSGIMNMRMVRKLNPNAADVFVYEITVTPSRGPAHDVVFDDTTLPESFRPLVSMLQSRSTGNNQPGPRQIPMQTIDKGVSSGITRCYQTVIRNQREWQSLWRAHNRYQLSVRSAPEVDFSRNMLIAIFAGTKNTGGYVLTIGDVQFSRNQLLVHATLTSPPVDRMSTQALSQPYEIVQVPRFNGRVVFPEDICN